MAIKYAGTNLKGYGKAQVYTQSNLVEQAAGVIAKQEARKNKAAAAKAAAAKAKKAAGNKMLDDLNKVDFSKVRDAEVGVITNGGGENQTIGVNGIYKFAQENLDAIIDPSVDGGKAKMQFEQHKTQLQGYIVQSINQKGRDEVDYKSMTTNNELYTEENEVGLAARKNTTIGSTSWSTRDVLDRSEANGHRNVENEDGSMMSVPTISGAGNYEITPDANLERELQGLAEELKNKKSTTAKGGTFSIGNGNLAVEFVTGGKFDEALVVQAGKNMMQNHKWNGKLNADLKEYLDSGYTEDEAIYEIMRPFLDEDQSSTIKTSTGRKSKSGNDDVSALNTDIVIPTEPMNTAVNITGGEGSLLLPISGNLSGSNPFFSSGIDKGEASRDKWMELAGLEKDNPYIDYSGDTPAVQYVPQGNAVMAFSKPTKNAKRTFQFQSPPNTRHVSSRKGKNGKNIPPGLLSKSEIFDVSPTDVRMMRTATEDIKVGMTDEMVTGNKTFNLTVKKGDWIPEWVFHSTNKDIIGALKSKPFKTSPWLMSIDEHKTSKPTIAAEFTPALFQKWSAWMIDNQENPHLYIDAMKKEIFGIEGKSK